VVEPTEDDELMEAIGEVSDRSSSAVHRQARLGQQDEEIDELMEELDESSGKKATKVGKGGDGRRDRERQRVGEQKDELDEEVEGEVSRADKARGGHGHTGPLISHPHITPSYSC
jgi:hypothetical protein